MSASKPDTIKPGPGEQVLYVRVDKGAVEAVLVPAMKEERQVGDRLLARRSWWSTPFTGQIIEKQNDLANLRTIFLLKRA